MVEKPDGNKVSSQQLFECQDFISLVKHFKNQFYVLTSHVGLQLFKFTVCVFSRLQFYSLIHKERLTASLPSKIVLRCLP